MAVLKGQSTRATAPNFRVTIVSRGPRFLFKVSVRSTDPPFEHFGDGHAAKGVPRQMAWPTKPSNQKRLLVIRVVHFGFSRAADYARRRLDESAFLVDVGIRTSPVALPLAFFHFVDFSPVPHVGGVAIEAVAADALVRLPAFRTAKVAARRPDCHTCVSQPAHVVCTTYSRGQCRRGRSSRRRCIRARSTSTPKSRALSSIQTAIT